MVKMEELSIAEVGKRLKMAGRFRAEPLCAFGSEEVPAGALPIVQIDRCLAKAMLMLALGGDRTAYLGEGAMEGCCPGGLGWLGHRGFAEDLKRFVSTGGQGSHGGVGEHLKRSPELVEASFARVGRIERIGRFTVFQKARDVDVEGAPDVRSVTCFGTAEQVRNLAALNHFGTEDVFGSAIMPWGATCATLVTYPAGLAANAPSDAVFVGPVDPTGNVWFPECDMAVAMPLRTARRMCEDLEGSFIARRPLAAYPKKRHSLEEQAARARLLSEKE